MPVLYVRLFSIAVLTAFVTLGVVATGEWAVRASGPIEWACPACMREIPTSVELRGVAGYRWAVCSDRCFEAIAADPQAYLHDVID